MPARQTSMENDILWCVSNSIQSHPRTPTWHRWAVCLLLFLATSINYMDRSVLGILAHTLDLELHWTEENYGSIVVAFTLAYAVGYLVAGRVIDRIGTRLGYALFVLLWTIAAMAHAAVTSVMGFEVARFALGFAESGNFPAAIRAISEWFPPEESALATGLFNSGSISAALVAPYFISQILEHFHSWRYAFVGVGGLGIVWLVFWLAFPYDRRENPGTSPADSDHTSLPVILHDPPLPWHKLLRLKQLWGFVLIKAMTDPVWWLYIFWLPKFLQERFHLTVAQLSAPLAIVYAIAALGAILGGWLSGMWIRRGVSALGARKRVLVGCAVLTIPLIAASHLESLGAVVALFSLITAAHQAWAANVFAANSDVFPRSTLSTAVGIAGAAGGLGGVLFQKFTGYTLEITHGNYTSVFLVAAMAYPLSLVAFHLLTLKPLPRRMEAQST